MRLLLTLPLVCLAAAIGAASCIGAWVIPHPGWAGLCYTGGMAACVALLCLLLAIPAAAQGLRLVWLVPLWVGLQAAATGWALLPAPRGLPFQLGGGVALLLPVMVIFLAACWRRLPAGLAETASASGASPLQTLVLARIRPGLPTAACGLGLVFALAFGLTPLLAAFSASP